MGSKSNNSLILSPLFELRPPLIVVREHEIEQLKEHFTKLSGKNPTADKRSIDVGTFQKYFLTHSPELSQRLWKAMDISVRFPFLRSLYSPSSHQRYDKLVQHDFIYAYTVFRSPPEVRRKRTRLSSQFRVHSRCTLTSIQ